MINSKIIKALSPIGIFVSILALASSCKKEKSVFAVADFTYSGRTDTVPTTIQFINKSFGISYSWDFGDGSSSTDKNPNHTFNQAGTYNVKLISKGTNNSDTMQIVIGIGDIIPRDGLVGWWPFNGNANDESGYGNHGAVNGATLTTDRFGNQNSAYNFNGVNSWIQVQDHVSLRPANITLATWVFLPENTKNYGLITKTNLQTAQGEQYSLQLNNYSINGNAFSIKRNSGCSPGNGWREVVVQTVNPINEWQFIVATYDGTTLRYYKNGVLSPNQVNIAGGIDNCTGGSLNFGRYWNCCNYLQGKLDDIGIWNRALTQQEITNLYNGGQ